MIFNNGINRLRLRPVEGYAPIFSTTNCIAGTAYAPFPHHRPDAPQHAASNRATPTSPAPSGASVQLRRQLYPDQYLDHSRQRHPDRTGRQPSESPPAIPSSRAPPASLPPPISPAPTPPTSRPMRARSDALLTGRVSAINRSVVLDDERANSTAPYQPIVRNHQREVGLYVAGFLAVLRSTPDLQLRRPLGPPESARQPERRLHPARVRGRVGRSGVGNLFAGRTYGRRSAVQCYRAGEAGCGPQHSSRLPSASPGWCRNGSRTASWLIGRGTRDSRRLCHQHHPRGCRHLRRLGQQPGRPSPSTSTRPIPGDFGAPGSVLFRNPVCLPQAAPVHPDFPLACRRANSITDFAPI